MRTKVVDFKPAVPKRRILRILDNDCFRRDYALVFRVTNLPSTPKFLITVTGIHHTTINLKIHFFFFCQLKKIKKNSRNEDEGFVSDTEG
jgi:hypothetical protein